MKFELVRIKLRDHYSHQLSFILYHYSLLGKQKYTNSQKSYCTLAR